MKLYNCNFSEKAIKELQDYRDRQEDIRLKLRFIAILSVVCNTEGVKAGIERTAEIFGQHIETVKNWLRKYLTGGAEKLNAFNYKPKKSYLNRYQINQVVIFVTYENPATVKEVRNYINEKFSVTYSVEAVRKLLIKNRLKVIRPRTVPGNPPSPEVQKKTVEKYYYMRYKPDSVTLFCDVMHMVHQNFPGLCWGSPMFPPVAETNSGRKRLNILGAYDPATYSFTHLTGEANCDAGRVIEYLELINKKYSQFSDIYLIVDNAKYFHAQKVSKWLDDHKKINLVFLPSYAPNLNLIERFRRFAKKKLVKNKYYKEYKVFRAKIFQFLNHVEDYVDEFKTLMIENFQIIKHNSCQQ
jgi:transposase